MDLQEGWNRVPKCPNTRVRIETKKKKKGLGLTFASIFIIGLRLGQCISSYTETCTPDLHKSTWASIWVRYGPYFLIWVQLDTFNLNSWNLSEQPGPDLVTGSSAGLTASFVLGPSTVRTRPTFFSRLMKPDAIPRIIKTHAIAKIIVEALWMSNYWQTCHPSLFCFVPWRIPR